MFNDTFIVDIETALKRRAEDALLIDVRTALEFNEASIPGAVNVPILNNAERVEIGTLYKEQGSDVARVRGVEIVAPKIPQLIETINTLRGNHRCPIIIFCWRGGLRSRAMTAFLRLAGFPAFQLYGGHKAFRRHVVDFFDHGDWGRMLVLRGLTGVGKTRVLQQLAQQNLPVIDLEGLANHRGSAFGGVGLGQQPGQKQFESLLWDALQSVPKGSWALTEGESRHIGKIILPARFFQSLQTEQTLWLETNFEKRIQIILEDYTVSELAEEAFIQPIQSLQRRLGMTEVNNMLELLRQKNWHELVSELMLKYYDPLYCHTKPDNPITVHIDPFNDDHTELLAAAKTILATEPAA